MTDDNFKSMSLAQTFLQSIATINIIFRVFFKYLCKISMQRIPQLFFIFCHDRVHINFYSTFYMNLKLKINSVKTCFLKYFGKTKNFIKFDLRKKFTWNL